MKNYMLLCKLLILSVVFTQTGSMQAQITSPRSVNIALDAMLEKGDVVGDVNYDNIDGSPFVNAEFMPGTLKMKNGLIYEDVLFRYNIYTDMIEFKDEESVLAFAQHNELDRVSFDNRTYIYGNFYFKDRLQKGYYQLLADGKCKLLMRRTSILKREQLPATEFSGGNYRDYFRNEEVYFITKDGRNLVPVRNNAKSILKALGDHRKELEEFISQGNLDLKKDEDLGEVIFFYNQINQ